jgi:hypothetical protein
MGAAETHVILCMPGYHGSKSGAGLLMYTSERVNESSLGLG